MIPEPFAVLTLPSRATSRTALWSSRVEVDRAAEVDGAEDDQEERDTDDREFDHALTGAGLGVVLPPSRSIAPPDACDHHRRSPRFVDEDRSACGQLVPASPVGAYPRVMPRLD